MWLIFNLLLPTDITIGFDPASYTVNEDDGFAIFMVVLVRGTLAKEVVVKFYTESGSAIGKDGSIANLHLNFTVPDNIPLISYVLYTKLRNFRVQNNLYIHNSCPLRTVIISKNKHSNFVSV